MNKQTTVEPEPQPARARILNAAMEAFIEFGYTDASTAKIAASARVSKRELYAQFGNKQAMLTACVTDRAGRMRLPMKLPPARTRAELAALLSQFGATVLREVSQPAVMAVFRLAILEGRRAPEVAATLETARRSIRMTARDILAQAQSSGLIGEGDPDDKSRRYLALLWGDLMVSLLLRLREAPGKMEINRLADGAAEDFLRLDPTPEKERPSPRRSKRAT